MNINKKDLTSEIKKVVDLINKRFLNEALTEIEKLLKSNKNNPKIYNLYGIIQLELNQCDDSIKYFKKAVELDSNYYEALNNLGNAYMCLGNFNEAINIYEKVLALKPEYAAGYNNLASAQNDLGEFEKAIVNYDKALTFDPNFLMARNNIIHTLTFYNPKNSDLNVFTKSNYELQNVKIPISSNKEISDDEVITFYNDCNKISKNYFKNLNFHLSQIWRRNTEHLNCNRHFEVFNKFKIIPKYCFGCFKVQIEINSIIDLIKLYFIFNDLNLKNNNSRKCMIELRSIASGTYKGLIYCSGLEDANLIYNNLIQILKFKIKRKYKLTLKRGCTEFGIEHPNYKIINKSDNNFMYYKNEWKNKEKIIDDESSKFKRDTSIKRHTTVNGVTLNDVLVMNNWIYYAKLIGDLDYKKLDENILDSKHMKMETLNQLEFRKNEYSKNKSQLS